MNELPKDIVAWSRKNWNKIHPMVRQDCIDQLRSKLPDDIVKRWCKQHQEGKEIGSDDHFFHMGTGMWIRNVLRLQLSDGELPPIPQPHMVGMTARNWDDFYQGALQELIEQEIVKGKI